MSRVLVSVMSGVLALSGMSSLAACSYGGAPADGQLSALGRAPRPGVVQEDPAVLALRDWDRRRAAAYASGSVAQLRGLYVDGAEAASADVRLLRSYAERGLVVAGMRTQVLSLHVLERGPRRLRLRVTDRLVGATVRATGESIALPQDSPTTRLLTLRRVGGDWRMASVRAEGGRDP